MSQGTFRAQFRRCLVQSDLHGCLGLLSGYRALGVHTRRPLFHANADGNPSGPQFHKDCNVYGGLHQLSDGEKLRFLQFWISATDFGSHNDSPGTGSNVVDFDFLKRPLAVFYSLTPTVFSSVSGAYRKIATVLIRGCVRVFRPDEAEKVLIHIMKGAERISDGPQSRLGVENVSRLHSQILTGYALLGDFCNAERFFLSAQALGLADNYAVAALLAAFDRSCVNLESVPLGHLGHSTMHAAEKVWEEFTRFPHASPDVDNALPAKRDTVLYSVMLSICEKFGRFSKGMELLSEMESYGIPRDIVVFNTLLGCLGKSVYLNRRGVEGVCPKETVKASRLSQCLRFLLDRIETENLGHTAITLNAAVRACEMNDQPEVGLDVISKYFMKDVFCGTKNVATESRFCGAYEILDVSGSSASSVVISPFASARPNVITSRMIAQICERLEAGSMAWTKPRPEIVGGDNSSIDMRKQGQTAAPLNVLETARTSMENCPNNERWHQELFRVISDIRPRSYETTDLVAETVKRVEDLVAMTVTRQENTQMQAVPYGSLVSNTASHGADVDITLIRKDSDAFSHVFGHVASPSKCAHLYTTRNVQQMALLSLLRQDMPPGMRIFQVGLGGRIPVLSLQINGSDDNFSRTIDITVDNWHGVAKTRFIDEELRRFYPDVTSDVIRLIKHWAKKKGICGQTCGFLGGYSWTLMALYYFRRVQHRFQFDSTENEALLQWLFRNFFHFYTSEFQWENEAVEFGKLQKESTIKRTLQNFQLYDPVETHWNLGGILSEEKLKLTREELKVARDTVFDRSGDVSRSVFALFREK